LDPDFKALRVRPGPDVESASVTEERTDLDTCEAALGTHEDIGRSTFDQHSASEWEMAALRGEHGHMQDQDQIEIETNLPYGRNGGMTRNGNGFAADSDKAADKTSSGP